MPTLAKAQLIEPESPWGPSSRPLIMEAIENAGYPCARVALRDRQVGEQRRKYPGTNKVINGPIERRFR
jgi:hypothetical protein